MNRSEEVQVVELEEDDSSGTEQTLLSGGSAAQKTRRKGPAVLFRLPSGWHAESSSERSESKAPLPASSSSSRSTTAGEDSSSPPPPPPSSSSSLSSSPSSSPSPSPSSSTPKPPSLIGMFGMNFLSAAIQLMVILPGMLSSSLILFEHALLSAASPLGFKLLAFSQLPLLAMSILRGSFPTQVSLVNDTTVLFCSVISFSVAQSIEQERPADQATGADRLALATVLAFFAISSLCTGLFMFFLGRFKLSAVMQ